jgi:hypothetical protein
MGEENGSARVPATAGTGIGPGDGHWRLTGSFEDPVLDELKIAIHVKHVGLVPSGPDPNREVWAVGIAAVE